MQEPEPEPRTLFGAGDMSKTEILRAIIAEKLTTAAQEILAVVERTVAGYEEEAFGFKQELGRQRRQLEALLQAPEIKLEATDDQLHFPVPQPGPVEASGGGGGGAGEGGGGGGGGGGGAAEGEGGRHEEPQHKYELSEGDGGANILFYMGEFMEQEEEEPAAVVVTPTQEQEPLTELGDDGASRSRRTSPRQSARRLQPSEPPDLVELRICILGYSGIEVLSTNVIQTCPLQELRCPRGLRESDFLSLLRSTFPQLAGDQPFDIFTTDRSRRLLPLGLRRLTPEAIFRAHGRSALYVRLKFQDQEELQPLEEFYSSQTEVAAVVSPLSLKRTRVESDRWSTPSRPWVCHPGEGVSLTLRIIEDPRVKVLSREVHEKFPLQELQCPAGLRESDFLSLLRSTFPPLAGDEPFDIFTADRSRKLHPLRVKTLTPEELARTLKSRARSFLYIRLKAPGERHISEGDRPSAADETALNSIVSCEAAAAAYQVGPESMDMNVESLTPEQIHSLIRPTNPEEGSPSPADRTSPTRRVKPERRAVVRPRSSGRLRRVDLKICIVEDSQIDVLPDKMNQKYPLQELRCPRGLLESDFLELLRSTFPQLAADRSYGFFTTDRSRRLLPLGLQELTPEEIHQNIGRSALYIQLKASGETLYLPQEEEEVDGATDPPVTSDRARHTSLVGQSSSTSQQTGGGDVKIEVDEDYDGSEWLGPQLVPESKRIEEEEEEVNDGDWEPERRDGNLRKEEPEMTRRPHRANAGGAPLSCRVCGILRGSTSFLIKHSWTHVDDPQRRCGVCGERPASAEELRLHLQGHKKTYSCPLCMKSFLSISGLRGHVARHNGETSYKCNICYKAYTEHWMLVKHRLVHGAEKLHRCDVCQKTFVSQTRLRLHCATHTDQRRLFRCSVCPKTYFSLMTLSRHLRKHSRPRTHACVVCGRKFSTREQLRVHVRSHSAAERRSRRKLLTSRTSRRSRAGEAAEGF